VLPEVEIRAVERIWPIVVSNEGLFQTPTLWEYLRGDALAALEQESIQPLTLLDLEDLERLMGLVQQSRALVEILTSKTEAACREREFASWYEAEGERFGTAESPFIGELFEAAVDGLLEALFAEEQQERYRELSAAER